MRRVRRCVEPENISHHHHPPTSAPVTRNNRGLIIADSWLSCDKQNTTSLQKERKRERKKEHFIRWCRLSLIWSKPKLTSTSDVIIKTALTLQIVSVEANSGTVDDYSQNNANKENVHCFHQDVVMEYQEIRWRKTSHQSFWKTHVSLENSIKRSFVLLQQVTAGSWAGP